jgi:hypothetical protein
LPSDAGTLSDWRGIGVVNSGPHDFVSAFHELPSDLVTPCERNVSFADAIRDCPGIKDACLAIAHAMPSVKDDCFHFVVL